MNPADFTIRRATLDDLPALTALWADMNLPLVELEKRLTEFQVVVGPDGALAGAVAMEVAGRHGRIHSEGFTDFGLADGLRPALLERLRAVAASHGLARLWTAEVAIFWRQAGFDAPTEETLKKLPEAWVARAGKWHMLQIRDDEALDLALEKEFARFQEAEKQASVKALRTARAVKVILTVAACALAAIAIFLALQMLGSRNFSPIAR